MHRPAILALATATPPHSLPQRDAADAAVHCCAADERQARVLRRLYETTTVQRRASVLLGSNGRAGAASDGPVREFFPPADQSPRGPTTAQRMAVFDRCAAPLATRACSAALASAQLAPHQVTHLVTI